MEASGDIHQKRREPPSFFTPTVLHRISVFGTSDGSDLARIYHSPKITPSRKSSKCGHGYRPNECNGKLWNLSTAARCIRVQPTASKRYHHRRPVQQAKRRERICLVLVFYPSRTASFATSIRCAWTQSRRPVRMVFSSARSWDSLRFGLT